MKITDEKINIIRNIERYIIAQTDDYNVRCRIDDEDHMRIEIKNNFACQKFIEKGFRKRIIDLNKGITMFVTLDLQEARPNEYDKKIKDDF